MMLTRMTRVIALEGSHGIGKSTLCDSLKNSGYCVLDEAFMDTMPEFSSRCVTRQMAWTCDWVKRVYEVSKENKVVFVDRSPYSSAMYNEDRSMRDVMVKLVDCIIDELRDSHNVNVETCLLYCESDDRHWSAVTKRLESEPFRRDFGEHDRGHFQRLLDRYTQEYSYLWKHRTTSPLDGGTVQELKDLLHVD